METPIQNRIKKLNEQSQRNSSVKRKIEDVKSQVDKKIEYYEHLSTPEGKISELRSKRTKKGISNKASEPTEKNIAPEANEETRLAASTQMIQHLEKQLEASEADRAILVNKQQLSEEKLRGIENQLTELQSKFKSKMEQGSRISFLEKIINDLKKELLDQQEQHEKELQAISSHHFEKSSEMQELLDKEMADDEEYEKTMHKEINKHLQRIHELELEAKNYQNEIAASRKQIANLNREKESLISIKDLLTKERELLEKELRSSNEDRYKLSDQVESLTSELSIKEEQVNLLKKEILVTKEEIKLISVELAKLTEYRINNIDEKEYKELIEFRNFVVQEYESQSKKLSEFTEREHDLLSELGKKEELVAQKQMLLDDALAELEVLRGKPEEDNEAEKLINELRAEVESYRLALEEKEEEIAHLTKGNQIEIKLNKALIDYNKRIVKNSSSLPEVVEKDMMIKQLELRSLQQEQDILKYQSELEKKKQENIQFSKTLEDRDQQIVSLKAMIQKRRERSKQDIQQVTSFLNSQILSSPTLKAMVETKKVETTKENFPPNKETLQPLQLSSPIEEKSQALREKEKNNKENIELSFAHQTKKISKAVSSEVSTPKEEKKKVKSWQNIFGINKKRERATTPDSSKTIKKLRKDNFIEVSNLPPTSSPVFDKTRRSVAVGNSKGRR